MAHPLLQARGSFAAARPMSSSTATHHLCGRSIGAVPALPRLRRAGCASPRGGVRVVASAAEVAGTLILSALPFVAVQALADSKYGQQLQERLQARKGELQQEAADAAAARAAARVELPAFYGPSRPLWLGPLGPADAPPYLDGRLPGGERRAARRGE